MKMQSQTQLNARYSIGQVAKIIAVESHTVRFWTNELSQYIIPEIGAGNRRYFNENHVEILKTVADLINNKGYTLSIVKKNGIKNSYEFGEVILEPQKSVNANIAIKIDAIRAKILGIIAKI